MYNLMKFGCGCIGMLRNTPQDDQRHVLLLSSCDGEANPCFCESRDGWVGQRNIDIATPLPAEEALLLIASISQLVHDGRRYRDIRHALGLKMF